MIQVYQFLMWILRKLLKLPRRWYNSLLELFEYRDWFIPVLLITVGVGLAGVVVGAVTAEVFKSGAMGGLACVSVWVTWLGFVLTAGIHSLYLVFKAEQQELIDALKSNG
jgi:uncharacterized membrane protein